MVNQVTLPLINHKSCSWAMCLCLLPLSKTDVDTNEKLSKRYTVAVCNEKLSLFRKSTMLQVMINCLENNQYEIKELSFNS